MKKIFLGILGWSIISCNTQSASPSSAKTLPPTTHTPLKNTTFFEQINKKSPFNTVKISSKIKIENGSLIPTLDAIFYIENGKKIWVNLSALFFNVARGVATHSGIKAYEKYNKTYIESDFSYLNQLLNVNFIDYQALQNLILGKTFLPINSKNFSLSSSTQGYELRSTQNQKIIVNGLPQEYQITLNYNKDFNLVKAYLSAPGTDNYLEIFYDNWQKYTESTFPQNVKIIIKNKKTDQILIENTKFDFSTMNTPYSVPSNYQKKEIK